MSERMTGSRMFFIAVVGLLCVTGCRESEPDVKAESATSPAGKLDTPSIETAVPEAVDSEEKKQTVTPLPKPASQDLKPKSVKNAVPGGRKKPARPMTKPTQGTPSLTEELKIAQQVILKGWENIKSISATMTTEVDQHGGIRQRRTGKATLDYKESDGVMLARMEKMDSIFADVNDQQVWTGERISMIYDGEFLYTIQRLHDAKYAYKAFYNPGVFPALGGPALLRQLASLKPLRLDPNFDLDGKIVYRFVGRRKPHSYMLAVDKKTGLLLKMWVSDSVNQSKSEADFTDFVINPDLPDEHFKFQRPEDAKYVDQTVQSPATPMPSPVETP